MQEKVFKDKYHIYEIEYKKDEIKFDSVDAIITFLEGKIQNHPIITYIATFDHYKHTQDLPSGEINPAILDGKNIIFCFGVEIPTPEVFAVRPRSIGVCELENSFIINFLVAPNKKANEVMTQFVKSIKTV